MTVNNIENVARAGYEAWNRAMQNLVGAPRWERLPDEHRDAWLAAAKAILSATKAILQNEFDD